MHKDKNLPYWLALIKTPRLGPKKTLRLINAFSDVSLLFKQKDSFYQALRLHQQTTSYLQNPDWKEVDKALHWSEARAEHSILMLHSQQYPQQLLEIDTPPPVLFVRGDVNLLSYKQQIAVVGSRKPTPSGKENAYRFADELSEANCLIISGLAAGIDTAAHLGALKSGKTAAVIGNGINICYPKSNQSLAEKIVASGVIISELPLDTPPFPENFPRRNRIISGLSLGVLVVEADIKSGTLTTTQHALDQGREVFAIPGSINNPRTRGCHALIKQGAKLTECIHDILEELTITPPCPVEKSCAKQAVSQNTLDDPHLMLLECLDYEPTKLDILIERSRLSIQVATSLLMDLELAGHVCFTYSGYKRVL